MARRIHPLVLTYDELKRQRERILNLISVFPDIHPQLKQMVTKIDETIALIPEEYRLTRYEWQRKHG